MDAVADTDDRVGRTEMNPGTGFRWLMRLFSLLLAGAWLFIAVMEARMGVGPLQFVEVVMGVLILLGTVAVLMAWLREGAGGRMLAIVALLHGLFAAVESGHNHLFAVLIAAGPYALLAVGFIYLDNRWPRQRVHPSDAITLRER